PEVDPGLPFERGACRDHAERRPSRRTHLRPESRQRLHPHRHETRREKLAGAYRMNGTTYVTRESGCAPATAFLDFVRPDLDAIEARLDQEITSDVRKVRALCGHVLSRGRSARPSPAGAAY